MATINIRNLPDELHERIARAAARSERSLEGEVRYTLAAAYSDSNGQTLRQRWLQETGERLRHLVFQLKADGFWRQRGPGTLTQLARMIGESSPAQFLGWMDGDTALTFEGAERIAAATGSCADWLVDGIGSPFSFRLMDDNYHSFFRPEDSSSYRFHLIRPETGAGSQVPLLVVRENKNAQELSLAYFGGHFYLCDGMGGTGRGKLKEFLKFLKRHSRQIDMRAYMLDMDYSDVGAHHPCHYLNKCRDHESVWLERMLKGEAPGPWLTEFSAHLDEVKNTPQE